MALSSLFIFVFVCVGELSGASDAGCARDGQGGFCQVAHRKRREHAPLPDNQSAGGALQHGNIIKHTPATGEHRCVCF